MGKLWGMLKLGTKLGLAGGTVHVSREVRHFILPHRHKMKRLQDRIHTSFSMELTNGPNKLEFLYLTCLSSLV